MRCRWGTLLGDRLWGYGSTGGVRTEPGTNRTTAHAAKTTRGMCDARFMSIEDKSEVRSSRISIILISCLSN